MRAITQCDCTIAKAEFIDIRFGWESGREKELTLEVYAFDFDHSFWSKVLIYF